MEQRARIEEIKKYAEEERMRGLDPLEIAWRRYQFHAIMSKVIKYTSPQLADSLLPMAVCMDDKELEKKIGVHLDGRTEMTIEEIREEGERLQKQIKAASHTRQ